MILYKKGAGNFDALNGWNSQADGLGTDYTATDSGGGIYVVGSAANTLDLNGVAVTLNVSCAAALIQSSNAGGYLDVSGTRTINGNVTYSSTSTSGMVRIDTGDALTINGLLTNSSSGRGVVGAGSGTLVISNVGSTSVSNIGTGRAISWGSTGTLSVTGAWTASDGQGLYVTAAATVSVTGNGTVSGGTGINVLAAASITVDGEASSSSTGTVFQITSGTLTWIGSRSVAAAGEFYCVLSGGTFALADGTGALTLSCSGVFVIRKTGGTLTTTSGANTASLVRHVAAAQIACLGQDLSAIITGPTLPDAEDVLRPADGGPTTYGYAGDAQTGTAVAGGGGYTYGDEDPSQVLTTAAGAGTYQPVDAAYVLAGVAVGVSPAVGTYAASGTYPDPAYVHADAGTYGPTGVEHAPGLSALSEYCRLAAIDWPAPAQVTAGVTYGVGTIAYTGLLSAGHGTRQAATGAVSVNVADRDGQIGASLWATLQFAGNTIVYHRGTKAEAMQAVAGKHTDQAVDAGGAILAEAERHDFILPLSSLVGFDPAEPQQEDWIEAFGRNWEITEQPGVGWWKFMDPARRWIRIRVTQTQ